MRFARASSSINVLARYYLREEDASRATQAQQDAARRILEGGDALFVAKTVLVELEWVLRGVYGIGRKDIARSLKHLLALPNVEIEDRASVQSALANLEAGFDFADALHHASSRACSVLVTFDARRFANRARRKSLSPPVRVTRWASIAGNREVHSITRSARTGSDCGIVSPSAFAVFRLITRNSPAS